LGFVLFGVWLLWSGHFKDPLLLGLGVVSCALVVAIALRMDTVDHEGHPMHLVGRAVVYWPWLLWAIIKANIDVALRILSPRLPISPTMVEVQTSQKSALGQVIYANSITLTPGTVSVDLTDGMIIVHALSRESAEALMDGEMDRRVTVMEGAS
jgi:multicomponent Na+:H+ antiporter subunit E